MKKIKYLKAPKSPSLLSCTAWWAPWYSHDHNAESAFLTGDVRRWELSVCDPGWPVTTKTQSGQRFKQLGHPQLLTTFSVTTGAMSRSKTPERHSSIRCVVMVISELLHREVLGQIHTLNISNTQLKFHIFHLFKSRHSYSWAIITPWILLPTITLIPSKFWYHSAPMIWSS